MSAEVAGVFQRGARHSVVDGPEKGVVKIFKKAPASTNHTEDTKPFFSRTAQVKDTETGGLMTRHLTSASDVENLGKEVSSPTRTTDHFFGGKDTFF